MSQCSITGFVAAKPRAASSMDEADDSGGGAEAPDALEASITVTPFSAESPPALKKQKVLPSPHHNALTEK